MSWRAESGALPRAFARANRAGSPAFAGAVQSALAMTVVLSFALFGLDPFADLLIKVNTPGVIGIILLQALAAAAAVASFLRRRDMPRRGLLVATSVVAAGLMTWVIYMVIKHLDVLTGAPRPPTGHSALASTEGLRVAGVDGPRDRAQGRTRTKIPDLAEASKAPSMTTAQTARAKASSLDLV